MTACHLVLCLALLGADDDSKSKESPPAATTTNPIQDALKALIGGKRKMTAKLDAELLAPIKLQADGQPIDVAIGHAAPFWGDFDGDGVADLLVGQFGDGKLRIYRNAGTNRDPRFEKFEFFQAEGKDASVPFG